jgi:MOSC domain-containing protein YiiM
MNSSPYLYQINCSQGGIPKLPLTEAWVSFEGLCGDGHRNKILHGGPDRAICVFSFEVIEALQQEGHTIFPGAAGENLTLAGLDWVHIQPGDQMKIGEAVRTASIRSSIQGGVDSMPVCYPKGRCGKVTESL